jgi:hypothetical protein
MAGSKCCVCYATRSGVSKHAADTSLMWVQVIQAFKIGIPVVGTPLGMEGLDAHDGADCFIGGTPEEFARKIVQAHTVHCRVWQRIAAGGVRNVREFISTGSVDRKTYLQVHVLPQPDCKHTVGRGPCQSSIGSGGGAGTHFGSGLPACVLACWLFVTYISSSVFRSVWTTTELLFVSVGCGGWLWVGVACGSTGAEHLVHTGELLWGEVHDYISFPSPTLSQD